MAQKFLSIKNFEKYQHYKHRNPPWIKLYNALLDDYEFSKLPTRGKYLYLGLLILCSRHDNRVPNDCTWIARHLHMDEKEIELTPLYKTGLLLASRNHVASVLHQNALSETEKSRDRERVETEADTHDPASASRVQLTDIEWMDSLRTNAGYAGVDIDAQRGRCEAWCQTNGKTFSRRRFINWLNRTEKPIAKPDWKEAFLRDEN